MGMGQMREVLSVLSGFCLKFLWVLFFFIITKLTLRIANRNKLFYNNHLQLLL